MDDEERTAQTARVLELLDGSFRAHHAGDHAASGLFAREAVELDVDCVSVIQGGILIGEIPNPETDYQAWADYVQAQQAKAGRAV